MPTKLPNLKTGIILATLILISFLAGIYATVKYREHNHSKNTKTHIAKETAIEQGQGHSDLQNEREKGGVVAREDLNAGTGNGSGMGRVRVQLNGVNIKDEGHTHAEWERGDTGAKANADPIKQ
jgi:hypothetical protein